MKIDIHISNVTNTVYDSFIQGLELGEAFSVELSVSPTAKILASDFEWEEGISEVRQMDQCIAWFHRMLKIPKGKQICSVAGQTDLLNRSFGPYSLRGTADLVFISDAYVKTSNIRGGIEIVVELKKEVLKSDFKQATLQLVSASSYSHYPVVVLHTDLREAWQFLLLVYVSIHGA